MPGDNIAWGVASGGSRGGGMQLYFNCHPLLHFKIYFAFFLLIFFGEFIFSLCPDAWCVMLLLLWLLLSHGLKSRGFLGGGGGGGLTD